MSSCVKCHKSLQDGFLFCPYCGARQSAKRPTKRGNGMGCAFKRGNEWAAAITTGIELTEDGKLKQKKKYKYGFKTKLEAVRYLETLRLQREADASRIPTLGEYWKAFEQGHLQEISDDKQKAYRIAWDRLSPFAVKEIHTITVGDLQGQINATTSTYYPARDMKNLLNQLFKMAAVEGHANASLPSLLVLPKLQETKREPFTAEEQQNLWKAYEEGCTEAAIPLIMIHTGMMPGELMDVRIEQVNLDAAEIVGAGKKTDERRTKSVLLPDCILPVLEDCIRRASENERNKDGRLFPGGETRFYQEYYTALETAGCRKLTPYSCRHTAATRAAVDASIAPQIVQRIMRWSSTKMMDRYVHPSEEDARKAINSI